MKIVVYVVSFFMSLCVVCARALPKISDNNYNNFIKIAISTHSFYAFREIDS